MDTTESDKTVALSRQHSALSENVGSRVSRKGLGWLNAVCLIPSNLVRNSNLPSAFLTLAHRNRTGTAVHECLPARVLAGNLLCYNLQAPLVDARDHAVS